MFVVDPMKQRKGKTPSSRSGAAAESAFDIWLNRGLHRLYGDIASEPIPESLLRLIEDDRRGVDAVPSEPKLGETARRKTDSRKT